MDEQRKYIILFAATILAARSWATTVLTRNRQPRMAAMEPVAEGKTSWPLAKSGNNLGNNRA